MKHVSIVLGALALVLCTHAITRAEEPKGAPPGVPRWEYHVELVSVLVNPDDAGKTLQKLGADGWELASTVQPSNIGAHLPAKAFFKRPLK